MTELTIRLDKARPYSTCHGDRTRDDPHYKVHFWQGGRFGKEIILLPFDSNGDLLPDDGLREPYQGAGIDPKGMPCLVMYPPLYDEKQAAYLKARLDRVNKVAQENASTAPQLEDEHGDDDGLGHTPAEDLVDFKAWLLGETRYAPHLIRSAMKKKYHLVQNDISEIVRELVLEHKIVPEDQVCADLARALKKAAA
jgi:hypothetical protein